MSRRAHPAPHHTPDTESADSAAPPCHWGLPAPYAQCCGRFHVGLAAAPTAERLMRARYSAYVVLDEAYLLKTWAPATRPSGVDLDPSLRWTGLEILDTTDGSAFHTTGTVTFRARYTSQGMPGVQHERSRFIRDNGAWVYVDGDRLD